MINNYLEKLSAILGYIGLIGGLVFWFSADITGNVIGETNSAWLGVVFILFGIIGMFFYTNSKRKSVIKKKTVKKRVSKKRKTKKKR